MTIKINNKSTEEKNEILVSFGKEVLEVSETSQDWNNQGINNFLIKLASATPDKETMVIDYDEEDENAVYKHIVQLFKSFTDEYNETL
ncbi:hypothetical protein [Mycoplasma todarodis]|uniref:Uncharacterized protein n=1 Tax=Mycoplasma todarodis TaxID=1937191 RepID=A0A4R0XX39_9MOLU|nr:hypothetical protein [Mycoplasma todarodis]TCG11571.1 hypothetical protein C4B25_01155 [Mycoplasma todarodis]